jgi:hypothetical protein
VTDRPERGPQDEPFDPFAQPADARNRDDRDTSHLPHSEELPDPDFDPERTTAVAPSSLGQGQPRSAPPAQQPTPAEEPFDPERTAVVPARASISTPAPVHRSGRTVDGAHTVGPPPSQPPPGASPPPSYAPPPIFSAQYVPQRHDQKDRRPLFIAIGGACVALIAVVVVIIVVSVAGNGGAPGSGGGSTAASERTPGNAAHGYLDALARGDSRAALSFGQGEPGSTDLLSDPILKKQIAEAPITDIKILDDGAPVGDYARVHASAKFGSQISDTQLDMRRTNGEWKLANAVVKIDLSIPQNMNESLKDLTVFGQPTTSPVYVFPGWVDYGSSNPNITFDAANPLLDQLQMFVQYTSIQVKLSSAGQAAINSVLASDLAKCTASNLLAPPGCPLKVDPTNLVDGTAQWGSLSDLSRIAQTFNPYDLAVAINGTVQTTLTAQSRSGGSTTGKLTGIISGTANLSTNPPTITYR